MLQSFLPGGASEDNAVSSPGEYVQAGPHWQQNTVPIQLVMGWCDVELTFK